MLAAASAAALLVTVMVGPSLPAQADPLDEKEQAAQQRAAEAQRQYELAQESVEDLSADLAQAVLALEETKARLPAAQAALDAATSAADAAQRDAARAQSELQDATDVHAQLITRIEQDSARADDVRATVAQLARAAYQGGSRSTGLEVAVGASSIEDFIERARTASTAQRLQSQTMTELAELEAAGRSNQVRLDSVVASLAELEEAAAAQAEAARVALDAQREQSAALERAVVEQTAATQRIEGLKGQAQTEQAQADAVRASADAEVARIAAEQEAAAAQQARPSSPAQPAPAAPAPPAPVAPPAAPPAAPASSSGALFSNPTSIQPMYVTSNYGMRLHPILGYYRLHAGIDLRTYCNTPLYAPRDGTVQWSQWRNGFGNQVMLNYGTVNGQSLMSSSNHLTRSVVTAGQAVTRGQLIGYSGNTGLSGACHLHFEVYVGGKTVDPAPLLGLR